MNKIFLSLVFVATPQIAGSRLAFLFIKFTEAPGVCTKKCFIKRGRFWTKPCQIL